MYVQNPTGPSAVNLAWLIRMRYLAALAQVTTILAARFFLAIPLPLFALLALVSLSLLTNVVLVWAKKKHSDFNIERWVGPTLLLDTFILSGLLYYSGGAANPFSIFYLVYIVLSAICLQSRWTWGITFFSMGLFALLFFFFQPIHHHAFDGHHHHGDGGFSLHLKGMWLTFALAACLLAYLINGLLQALRHKDAAMQRMQQEAQKRRELLSLASITAGAAHELNTPLGTIALITHELLQDSQVDAEMKADLLLIEDQVERCQAVIEKIAAPSANGQAHTPISLHGMKNALAQTFAPTHANPFIFENQTGQDCFNLPASPIESILRNLLKNALDASPPNGPIRLRVENKDKGLRFIVEDEGTGMDPTTLEKACDPFFTTKPAGKGMGLGLFLSQMLCDQMNASLHLESKPGHGTRATLEVL